MNFLAHILLSGDSDDVKIGNFIGDHVKGKNYLKYSPMVQKGIILHRKIDTFTDTPNSTDIGLSKDRLRPVYGKYAGVVIDVLYDHFLIYNWERYSNKEFEKFCNDFYRLLKRRFLSLPLAVQKFVPFLITNKRLQSYGSVEGINKVLNIMATHSGIPDKADEATQLLVGYHQQFNSEFVSFFDRLWEYVEHERTAI